MALFYHMTASMLSYEDLLHLGDTGTEADPADTDAAPIDTGVRLAANPADLRRLGVAPDDLRRLGLDPGAVRVTAARSRKASGSVRIWIGDNLAAGTCCECRGLIAVRDLVRSASGREGRQLRCTSCAHSYMRRWHTKNATRSDEQIIADRERLRPTGRKRCGGCRESLPFDDYSQSRRTADGLHNRCRSCSTARATRRLRRRIDHLHPDPACYICGGPFEEVDHIIPASRGGDDSPANLAPACRSCNRGAGGKFDADPREYLAGRIGADAAWDFLAERLPASLLIGESLANYASCREGRTS